MNIQQDYALSGLTTFRIGGKADFYAPMESLEDLKQAISFAKERKLQVLILGGGSNVLISDEGFRGLVIQNKIRGVEFVESGDFVEMKVGAGEIWDDVVALAVSKGLWGIENLSNIPGLAGGFPVQNVGAYGQEASQVVEQVEAFDLQTGQTEIFLSADCGFKYRSSRFNTDWKNRYVILNITLRLDKQPKPNWTYVDVRKHFETTNNRNPSLLDIRNAIIEIRKNKFPDLSQIGTAGSFFKNLLLDKNQLQVLDENMRKNFDAGVISNYEAIKNKFPVKDAVKIPAAYLVDICGLKGRQVGGAKLWEKQPLVIVNTSSATASDVISLFNLVKDEVFSKTGMALEAEPEFIGF